MQRSSPVDPIGSQTGEVGWSGGKEHVVHFSSFYPPAPLPSPFLRLVPHALSQTLMGRQTDSLAWIEQGQQPATPLLSFQKRDSPIPLFPPCPICSHTASTHSCSPQFSGLLKGFQTPSTLQPLSLTLHKLDTSPWCLVSRSGHAWPQVCHLPICCSCPPSCCHLLSPHLHHLLYFISPQSSSISSWELCPSSSKITVTTPSASAFVNFPLPFSSFFPP